MCWRKRNTQLFPSLLWTGSDASGKPAPSPCLVETDSMSSPLSGPGVFRKQRWAWPCRISMWACISGQEALRGKTKCSQWVGPSREWSGGSTDPGWGEGDDSGGHICGTCLCFTQQMEGLTRQWAMLTLSRGDPDDRILLHVVCSVQRLNTGCVKLSSTCVILNPYQVGWWESSNVHWKGWCIGSMMRHRHASSWAMSHVSLWSEQHENIPFK